MNRKILGLLSALALAAGCDIATKTDWQGPVSSCKPAGPTPAACIDNAECCSYACLNGLCARGTQTGTVCATTNDCGYSGATQLLCKSGHCDVATCRDMGDVCATDLQCCGGNRCTTGMCLLNRAPVINVGPLAVANYPVKTPFQFTNNTTDPDGDAMTATWTLTSKPTTPVASTLAFGPVSGAPGSAGWAPSFTPDVPGTYVFHLVVTDLPAPSKPVAVDIAISAVNLAPVVTPVLATDTWQRNVGTFKVDMKVYDENVGDTVTCTWKVCRKGTATCETAPAAPAPITTSATVGSKTFPATVSANPVFSRTMLPDDEGPWDVTLSCADQLGAQAAVATTTVTLTNTPPVPAVTQPTYYTNLTAAGTAVVNLDASVSTDPNGDHLLTPGLSYFWEGVTVSDGSAFPSISGFNTATPSFTSDRVADYVLRVTVTDPPSASPSAPRIGASVPLLVTVKVGRYIRQLAHDVTDSAFAKTANKLVMGGHDPANQAHGMVWVLDAATDIEGTGILLFDSVANVYGVPKFVGVTPDGTKAVVVDDNTLATSVWFITFGATPTVSRVLSPYATVVDSVVATNRWAYIFSSTWTFAASAFKEIDLNNNSMANAPWSGYQGYGAASSSATNNYIYRVETSGGAVNKFPIGNNGSSNTILASGYATCGGAVASDIWPILADKFVVSSCGSVYRATDLVSSGTLGVLPGHMDSTSTRAMAANGSTLTLYDATLVQTGTATVPAWGDNYIGRTATVSKAWFNSTGTKEYALVSDSKSPARYGLVIFP